MEIPQACWHNIAETAPSQDGSGIVLSRIPFALLPGLNQKARERALCPAGAELRFCLRPPRARLILRRLPDGNPSFAHPGASLVGIFHGDFQHKWCALGEGDTIIDISPLPPAQAQTLAAGISAAGKNARARFNPALTRVILPLFPAIQMVSFEGDIEPPLRSDIPARQYLAYGSSITHGAYTPLGTATYPAIIAQQLGTDVSNLGLGGGAHLEPEMAEWLAERQDWDFASLELGINLLGGIEVATFRSRVRRFLTPFADESPLRNVRRRPVICLDVLRNARDITPGHKDRDKAEAFRNVVTEEVAALNCPWISHVPFRDAVSISALSDDLLHPSSAGFEEIGRHLANEFRNVPGMAELLGNS